MSSLIEERYSDGSWQGLITGSRIKKAKRLLSLREGQNEATGLLDCLQFCDKGQIVMCTGGFEGLFGQEDLAGLSCVHVDLPRDWKDGAGRADLEAIVAAIGREGE